MFRPYVSPALMLDGGKYLAYNTTPTPNLFSKEDAFCSPAAHVTSNFPCLLGTLMNPPHHTHTLAPKQPVPQPLPFPFLHPSIGVPSPTPEKLQNQHSTHPPLKTPSAIPSLHKNLETPAPHSRSAALSSRTATAIAARKTPPIHHRHTSPRTPSQPSLPRSPNRPTDSGYQTLSR